MRAVNHGENIKEGIKAFQEKRAPVWRPSSCRRALCLLCLPLPHLGLVVRPARAQLYACLLPPTLCSLGRPLTGPTNYSLT
jgi:hypothetical protein